MKKPCHDCVVKACCTKPCTSYAEWIYESGEYKQAGKLVTKTIEEKSYEDAINHILMIENIALAVQKHHASERISE